MSTLRDICLLGIHNLEMKATARSQFQSAKIGKKIEPKHSCEICGDYDFLYAARPNPYPIESKAFIQIEAHHYDYAQPLAVVWLCHKCHMQVHANIGRLEREAKNYCQKRVQEICDEEALCASKMLDQKLRKRLNDEFGTYPIHLEIDVDAWGNLGEKSAYSFGRR